MFFNLDWNAGHSIYMVSAMALWMAKSVFLVFLWFLVKTEIFQRLNRLS